MKLKSLLPGLCLIATAASPCFAEMVFSILSKEETKKLGMEVRTTANGPNEVWVELEFKPEGALKRFDHVDLEIMDGEKFLLGYTALEAKRSSSGSVTVSLLANRVFLEKTSLMFVEGEIENYSGYLLRMKEFVDLKKVNESKKIAVPNDQPAPPAAEARPVEKNKAPQATPPPATPAK